MFPKLNTSKEITIRPHKSKTLQELIDSAMSKGFTTIILEGTFKAVKNHQFSLLNVSRNLEIRGKNNPVIDGLNKVAHLVFVEDGASLKVTGVTFQNGNTSNEQSQKSLQNHPKKKLNIFQYLDGGAINMGLGSTVELNNCAFKNNTSAVCGGAISNLGGYLRVINCVFENNTCGDTGAAIDNLAKGSISVILNSTFISNHANKLGQGNYGAITAFPDTYLVVAHCDFTRESFTAIDYHDRKGRKSYLSLRNCMFNDSNPQAIVVNPSSNGGARKEILRRFFYLLIKKPHLIKLQSIPAVIAEIKNKHKGIFDAEAI